MQTSVIVSTYNRPDALMLTLKSLTKQTILPDEIMIADDGSTKETAETIEAFRQQFEIPVVHCWQEDKGFRLALVRNLALAKCHFDYVIQIDGDIITHPKFVEDHLSYARENVFLSARRINLNENDTRESLKQGSLVFKEKSNIKLTHRLRSKLLMKVCQPDSINKYLNKGVIGCNMSYWLKDAKLVNGYNEDFRGWGKEDDEFALRLSQSGIKRKTIRFGAIQYHLEHPNESRERLEINTKLLAEQKNKT